MKQILSGAVIGCVITLGFGCSRGPDSTKAETPKDVPVEVAQTFTRSYELNKSSFFSNLKRLAPNNAGLSNEQQLLALLQTNGIKFQQPSDLSLDEKQNVLIVRNSMANLDKVERLVLKLNQKE